MIKDLVVHLDGSEADESRIRHAEAVAASCNAHLAGLLAIPLADFTMAVPFEAGAAAASVLEELNAEARRQGDEFARRLAGRFSRLSVPNDLRRVDGTLGELTDHAVAAARRADLFVTSRPYHNEAAASWTGLFEAVLFGGGRGIYVVPPGGAPPARLERALIAWRETREATRALAEAMPILEGSSRAMILLVDAEIESSTAGTEIARHLSCHGLEVEIALRQTNGWSVSDVLLEEARRMSAQLIVMGGYGHSRAREWVLGGATRDLLARSAIPILMAH